MKKILFTALLALSSFTAFADNGVDLTLLKERVGDAAEIKGVKPSVIDGLFEVEVGGQIIYLTADGEKVISGDIYDLKNKKSVTEEASNKLRKAILATVADADKIIYKAKNEKYKVTIFTDVSCPYCTKIHNEVPKFNDLGITVEYLAFPRAGIGSRTAKQMQKVWCAENRTVALTNAKVKDVFPTKTCDGKQVAQQYKLGEQLGIRATPTMVLSDGEILPGYIKPDELAEYLGNK
ncbi:MAG: hypothetical protein CR955_01810 [Thiotrichales bacterium]|nr:MAG: hypothetical protein CR955_01810 [Thiotrichales bacterium]